jgi:hypothetical protein
MFIIIFYYLCANSIFLTICANILYILFLTLFLTVEIILYIFHFVYYHIWVYLPQPFIFYQLKFIYDEPGIGDDYKCLFNELIEGYDCFCLTIIKNMYCKFWEIVDFCKQLKPEKSIPINKDVIDACEPNRIKMEFVKKQIDLNAIKKLIEDGGDVNTVNDMGWTTLHFAVIDKNIDLVKFLIKHKANVKAKNSDKLPPLWYSIEQKTDDISVLLMRAGANSIY